MSTQDTMAEVAAELSAAPTETPAPEAPAESASPETPATDTSNASAPTKEEPGTPAAAASDDDEPQLDPSKPLPFEVHKRILERTRSKHSEELKKYDGVDVETATKMKSLQQWMDADPVGFYEYYGGQLRRNGVLKDAPAAQPERPQGPPPDPKPEPDVLLTDGRLVYSAEGMDKLLAWQGRQFEKSVDARYGKYAQSVEREQEDRRLNEQAMQMLEDARTNWEGFKEYEKDIAAYMASDGRATLQSAYRAIVPKKLNERLATAREEARKELLAELKRQSVSTEAPGPVPQAGPRDYSKMSTAEVLRAEAQRLGFK